MIDFYTKGVSRKVGGVCKRAVEEGYDAYDTLHTLSCKSAIEDIESDFRIAA